MTTRAIATLTVAFFAGLDVSAIATIIGGVVMLTGALAIGSSRQKAATIKDLQDALAGKEERLEETQAQLAGASARADSERDRRHDCENEIAARDATIAELRQYTAKAALGELKDLAERLAIEAASRHAQLLEHYDRHEQAIITALGSQGELTLKVVEIMSRVDTKLGPVAGGD